MNGYKTTTNDDNQVIRTCRDNLFPINWFHSFIRTESTPTPSTPRCPSPVTFLPSKRYPRRYGIVHLEERRVECFKDLRLFGHFPTGHDAPFEQGKVFSTSGSQNISIFTCATLSTIVGSRGHFDTKGEVSTAYHSERALTVAPFRSAILVVVVITDSCW
jgi:hypothetical protein